MRIDHLRYFVALSDAGSFYQAAKKTEITAQALSKILMTLEKEFGATFATRDRYGIHLTPAGEAFLKYAKRAVRDYDKTARQIKELSDK